MSLREKIGGTGPRVYEYLDESGNTYYSFNRTKSVVSPPIRLVLQTRLGVHWSHFLVKFRHLVEALKLEPPSDG